MAKFYVLSLNFAGVPSEYHPKIEAVLNPLAEDWLRFGNYQYIVATNLTAQQLYETVKPCLPTGAFVVVLAVDIRDRGGWASRLVIDWLKKHAP